MELGEFLDSPGADALGATILLHGPPELGTQIGPYKLREILGEGGMGIVYAGEQEQPLRRKVALKVIKPGMDSREVIARFEAERQALALMDHPNIAKALDAGTTQSGRPFFVMELVRGLPLTNYCDQAKLPLRGRVELFIAVCQAVQHAHHKGIIHRDLKPSNVLVTLHDSVPVPRIIDFGVAKALNQRLTEQTVYTRVAQLLGTPMYMSPEQAELSGLDVDTRSDVYALGVLLYELLTGQTPFKKEVFSKLGYDQICRTIREDEPPRPSARFSTLSDEHRSTIASRRGIDERQLSRTLRGELDWIVMKALEKDRARRYGSAEAFAADLRRYLDDEPVQAFPPTVFYRASKLVRHYRAASAAIAIITLVVLAATAFSTLKYLDERAARREADIQKSLAATHAERAKQQAAIAIAHQREAEHQKRAAVHLSTRSLLELGTRLLNAGDSRGLVETLEACRTAEQQPELAAIASVVSHADGSLFSAARARLTLARMSSAFFVQTNVFGLAL